MRKGLLSSLVVVVLTLPFLAQTADWKMYSDDAGNFKVLFPVNPKDSVNKEDEQIRSHTLMAVDGSYYYMVIYSAMASDQPVDDATYKVFKDAVLQQLPACQVGVESAAKPELKGYIGRRYRLKCDTKPNNVMIMGNIYWGKRYAYAVLAMFRVDVAEPQAADKFLDSFAVLRQ